MRFYFTSLVPLSGLLACTAANLPPGVQGPRWPSIFEAPGFHLNIAKKDIENIFNPIPVNKADAPHAEANGVSKWLEQAGKDIGRELSKVNIGDSWRYRTTTNQWNPDVQLPNFFENPGLHISIALGDVGKGLEQICHGAAAWTEEADQNLQRDPGRTILNAVLDGTKVGLMFMPGLLWGPVVNALGFGVVGVGPGTAAAAAQSSFGGFIAANSPFAFLQSAGAGGYNAVVVLNTFVRGGVGAWIGADWIAKRVKSDETDEKK